ncbi:uncharacterized protein BJX67DRAFT_380146 [Aspergillus lucknowensis]|uniref:Uncharacterized protein n=1 Tax=Aspergillus lucknowensis TaxID=176173 RepID=A0ABR4LUW4_9EURO
MANRLIPLAILVVVVTVLVAIGFITYRIVRDVKSTTKTKMEKRNVMVTRDGMTVGVKELGEEDILVNMWNHTSFPAYKSRLWDMTGSASGSGSGNGEGKVEHRKGLACSHSHS